MTDQDLLRHLAEKVYGLREYDIRVFSPLTDANEALKLLAHIDKEPEEGATILEAIATEWEDCPLSVVGFCNRICLAVARATGYQEESHEG